MGSGCNLHGGKALKGIASPSYKGKDYSAYLPKRMLTRLTELQNDPERLSLIKEVDLLRLHLIDILEDAYDDKHAFAVEAVYAAAEQVRAAYRKAGIARQSNSAEKMAEALTEWGHATNALFAALDPAVARDEGRRKAQSVSLALDRLLRTENTVRLAERGMMSIEAVVNRENAFIGACIEALNVKIRDLATRTALRVEIARIYSEYSGRRHSSALSARPDLADVIDAQHSTPSD